RRERGEKSGAVGCGGGGGGGGGPPRGAASAAARREPRPPSTRYERTQRALAAGLLHLPPWAAGVAGAAFRLARRSPLATHPHFKLTRPRGRYRFSRLFRFCRR